MKRNETLREYQSENSQIKDREVNIRNHPAVVALITHVGPFNYGEWQVICLNPKQAESIAIDFLKDMALLVEGAKSGAGKAFQKRVLTASPEEVNLPELIQAENERTEKPLSDTYCKNAFIKDVSSFLLYGKIYQELTDSEQNNAQGFGPVIDLGHFSRIMQKDISTDDVHKKWQVEEVGLALERNLHATFTHRGQEAYGEIADLYPIPGETFTEAKLSTAEYDQQNVLSVISERQKPPNTSFLIEITAPEHFEPITVKVNEGRGVVSEKKVNNTQEYLSYLSSQFESLLLAYPLEKAALIFDKLVYTIDKGRLKIQLSAIQRVKTADEQYEAKVLSIGKPAVAILTQDKIPQNGYEKYLRLDTSDIELIDTAKQVGVKDDDIPIPPLSKNQKNRLIGKTKSLLNGAQIKFSRLVSSNENDASIGSTVQACHLIQRLPLQGDNLYVLIPSSVASKINPNNLIDKSFPEISDVVSFLTNSASRSSNLSFSIRKASQGEIQVIKKDSWTSEIVIPQLKKYFEFIQRMQAEYDKIFVSMQFAHLHPTAPKHTGIQEQAADIARIIGEELLKQGILVEGRSLIDEYHTHDRMTDWRKFLSVLEKKAGVFLKGLIQESSPVIRLIGDAHVRMMLDHPNTVVRGGTLEHMMPSGGILEIWDGAQNSNGELALGRQACVPFNTGMDVVLMEPELADELYNKYLLSRYPESNLAEAIRQNPNISVHAVIAGIMQDLNLVRRNETRLGFINEVERHSFEELLQVNPDLTGFDLLALYEIHRKIKNDISTKRRFPVVTHILETNYNAQQGKAAYLWEQVGFPEIPIFRISFNPETKKIEVLVSNPPKEDHVGKFLEKHFDSIQKAKHSF